ncbi:uncharacterized protein BP01DRAFT_368988 [Aspergillus saccharolyticus JOP 1030-1]|uniref:Uncharacterized protein n=1 Tax=Aspergillus saccharolyticus JOP 1030-1 TaxID=1450539 RepID=A0A318Z2J1_9EURO|nr:hypothetical protein BP01DRAFT_368988 [Aspergillus saccharolyticus JOP 1030-1]PYH41505.1 hypothetical protein BP01DRAFT_368988 [Aspergillus saccharolyticus JOP 1030-1]
MPVCRHLIYMNAYTEKASTSASSYELMLLSKSNSAKSSGPCDCLQSTSLYKCMRSGPQSECGNQVPSEYDLIVRNPVISGLGVMFLELAYQAPFDNLKQDMDFGQKTKIIKKYLNYNFSHNANFQSPALQDAFYYQVIGGLEEIEKKLQQLQLD